MPTTTGTLSDWQTSEIIALLAAREWWASLHYADPRVGVPTATEIPGASYRRLLVPWTAAGPRLMSSAAPLDWANLATTTIAFVGLFDSANAGNLRAAMALEDPYPVEEGAPYRLAAGDLYLSW